MFQKNRLFVSLALAACVLLSAGTAFADGVGSVATAKKQTHLMSITFSPLHLLLPMVEITGEFKAHDKMGVALVGGYGSATTHSDLTGDVTFNVWEAGAQFRYYLLGDFDNGMQLGAEAMYIGVSNDNIQTSSGTFSGSGQGLALGPFIGYKFAADFGFTFDGQLGIEGEGIGASAKHVQSGASESKSGVNWGPLLNLNIGWSF